MDDRAGTARPDSLTPKAARRVMNTSTATENMCCCGLMRRSIFWLPNKHEAATRSSNWHYGVFRRSRQRSCRVSGTVAMVAKVEIISSEMGEAAVAARRAATKALGCSGHRHTPCRG